MSCNAPFSPMFRPPKEHFDGTPPPTPGACCDLTEYGGVKEGNKHYTKRFPDIDRMIEQRPMDFTIQEATRNSASKHGDSSKECLHKTVLAC